MRKTIIFGFLACIIITSALFCTEYSAAQERTLLKGPYITISGKVDFPEHKEGQRIRIFAKTFSGMGRADISGVDIVKPGKYSLKVPQNIGKVYIEAGIIVPGATSPIMRGKYANNPLSAGRSDIDGIDIVIKAPRLRIEGPTVTISGKVDFPGYKEGQRIRVVAQSFPERAIPDIAFIDIPEPGKYYLKVPQNIGVIYIGVAVLGQGEEEPKKGSLNKLYSKDPIEVRSEDISEINITLP